MLKQLAQWFCLPLAFQVCATTDFASANDGSNAPMESAAQLDLKLVAVRLVDTGDVAQETGPCYRITVRNTSAAVADSFEVSLLAGIDFETLDETAEVRARIERLDAGEELTVDLRLPAMIGRLRTDAQGKETPYRALLVVVDPQQETRDRARENNRTVLDRKEIEPVEQEATPFAARS